MSKPTKGDEQGLPPPDNTVDPAHLHEVRAQAEGQNIVEPSLKGASPVDPKKASTRPPWQAPNAASRHDWERTRPLETSAAPTPSVDPPQSWRARHGRFTAVVGPGGKPLRLLLARKNDR